MSEVSEVQKKLKDLSKVLSDTDKLIGLERLLVLANHGVNGKQVQDVFDLGTYHKVKGCRTAGCMIGECPGIFKEWMWDEYEDYEPCLKEVHYPGYNPPFDSGKEFFNINTHEFQHLFIPGCQNENLSYKKPYYLDDKCTKRQVGLNILEFILYKIGQIREEVK